MHTFESKEGSLIKEFGDRLTYDLKGFIESLSKQIEDKKARLEELQAKDKESSEKQNQLGDFTWYARPIDSVFRGKM